MSEPKIWLFVALGALTAWFVGAWRELARKGKGAFPEDPARRNNPYHLAVGFVMCFFDTLGIGNFATTTSAFKFRSSMLDEKIPGTLNVGYALPTVAQAYIYISAVKVDAWTLVSMIAASVLGAWLGAGVVARWPRRYIQVGMGLALLSASTILLMQIVATQKGVGDYLLAHVPLMEGVVPEVRHIFQGGEVLGLAGPLLGLGLFGNFCLGALMTLGIGLYAPCLILVSLLGMSPSTAFPIMMGSCAFLMPTGGIRFIRAGSYSLPASVALTVAGIPAVLIAAYLVVSMNVDKLRWVVLLVVIYTAVMMLRSARSEGRGRSAA
jgi:uncharacterized membrane protein YfcA